MILRRPVMDIEGLSPGNQIKKDSWRTVLALAYQSLGVVYGDLSTSPLYVYKSTFAEDIHHSESNEEIFGVLSFVFWTLTLIPLIKYVFIVLRADDNGEGGTFALYSLLCRHARVSILPNGQLADEDLYEYKKEGNKSNNNRGLALKLRSILEKYRFLQKILLTLALIGTCMVIGDGVLTPAISVFSAVSGLELVVSKHHHHYIELPVTCMILVFLFYLQHYGTHRIGFLFAPIVITWLFCISAIGVYNIFHWNPHVYQALSPYYMYKFLRKTQKRGWMSLGGILLCITGSEAMFADLGHFSQLSIKVAFTCAVYPSLILAYMGQAAYLSKHHIIESDYQIGFYVSVPENLRWPVLAIAILAAVVGSQAIITGTFSIIKQCCALGCFPRVKIIHTSSKICGQIYIPEINWTLMLLCLAVTIGFRNTKHISNASGLAVITVMLVTTCLMSLVIILCWNKSVLFAICFILFFGSVELLYFSASLIKFLEGAWVPLALSFIFLVIMFVWHYGTLKKYEFDVQNKVPLNWLLSLGPTLGIVRVRGIGLIHTQLVSGIPAIFSHFVTNLPAFHQVLVLFCIKYVPVPHVRPEERFLVGRVGPKEYRVYRVIARYGYHDVILDDVEFERDLICSIAEFIRSDGPDPRTSPSDGPNSKYNSSIMIDGASPEFSPLDRPGLEFSLIRGSPPQYNNLTWSDGLSVESSHLERNGSIWSGQPSPKLSPSGETGTDHNGIIRSDGLCSEFSPTDGPHPKFNGDDEKMAVIGTPSTVTKGMIETWDNDDEDEKSPFRETGPTEMGKVDDKRKRVRFRVPEGREMDRGTRAEMQELMEAREAGMAFILGHSYVRAKSGSGFIKRIAINVLYDFLRRNSTSPTYAASFPRASTLEVGMIYHV